jgi:hypothetical protein
VEDVFTIFGEGDFAFEQTLDLLVSFEICGVEGVLGFRVALLGSTQKFGFFVFLNQYDFIVARGRRIIRPRSAWTRLLGDRGYSGRGLGYDGGGGLLLALMLFHYRRFGGVGFWRVLFRGILGECAEDEHRESECCGDCGFHDFHFLF